MRSGLGARQVQHNRQVQPFEETRQKIGKPSCVNFSSGFFFFFHLLNFLITPRMLESLAL